MQSESIGKLATALAKAQGEFKPIKKDKTAKIEGRANFEYDYADLATVIDATRAILASNGLAMVQRTISNGGLTLESRLIHSSGEWIAATYPLPAGGRAQEMGSALTYARRYSWCSLLGIAPENEDDDGKNAAETTPQPRRNPSPPVKAAPLVPPTNGPGLQLLDPSGAEPPMIYQKSSQFLTALGRAMHGADDPAAWWALNGPLAQNIASKFPQAKPEVQKLAEMAEYGREAMA